MAYSLHMPTFTLINIFWKKCLDSTTIKGYMMSKGLFPGIIGLLEWDFMWCFIYILWQPTSCQAQSLKALWCFGSVPFFYSSAEKDVILAALFSQLLDSRKSWKLNNLETSFFSIYIGASQKIRIWWKSSFFSCNLFQKVKLSYILDSLHVQ